MTCNQEKAIRQPRTICELVEMLSDPVLACKFAEWWNVSAREDGDGVFPFEINMNDMCAPRSYQNVESYSITDQDLEWIRSLLEQEETRHPNRKRRILCTIGVIQGFLRLLSESSQMSVSQQSQIKNIIRTWEKAIAQKSDNTQESEC